MRGACLLVVLAGCLSKPAPPSISGDGGPGGVDAAPAANYVFVSSQPLALDATLDTACTAAAHAHNLPGDYVAWVSLSSPARVAKDSLAGSRGWVRPDGKPVVDQVSDLLAGRMFYPIRRDELDRDALTFAPSIATGTAASGDPRDDCEAGTITNGYVDAEGGEWTDSTNSIACIMPAPHVYCFGIGKSVPVAPTIDPTARIAFLSEGNYTPSTPGAADMMCNTEAHAHSLTGTFLALLAMHGVSASSRFQPGAPWSRVDGVQVTADFVTWDAPLDMTAGGIRRPSGSYAYTGATSPTSASLNYNTCSDWQTPVNTATAILGDPDRSLPSNVFDVQETQSCTPGRPIYCFQQ